jgi:uncharacterized protein (TIGR03435 family)
MPGLGVMRETHRHRLLASLNLMTFVVLSVFALLSPTLARAQSAATSPQLPDYKYEVASIKPSKATSSRWGAPSDDAFTVTGVPLRTLVQVAFHITGDYGLSGDPSWLNSERYDVDAKMDNDVADALKKLRSDERDVVRQHMLQALLVDRFGLVFHRETKEVPVYYLVIAKNGPKLHPAKPGDTYPNGIKLSNGLSGRDLMIMGSGPAGSFTITAQAVPLSHLLPQLAFNSGRPVLDKTGLKDNYDFKLTYSLEQTQPASAPNSQTPLTAEPGAPSLFTALQEQLGLKLEAGKGPVEIIVIDHIERASGN